MPSFTDEPISVPAQFQIRTVFDDNIHSTDEIFSDHSMTFFGNPATTLIDQPLAPYISPSPYGPPIDDLGSLRVWMSTSDQSSNFFEGFSIQLYSVAHNNEGQWTHNASITVILDQPARNGDGTSDFFHTSDQLWDFLSAFHEGTSSAYGSYYEYFSSWDFNSASHIEGKQWSGLLRLASLQRLDASQIPEPAPFALLGIGFLTTCLIAGSRRAKATLPAA